MLTALSWLTERACNGCGGAGICRCRAGWCCWCWSWCIYGTGSAADSEEADEEVPGVPLRHTPTPPPQLRVLPGYVYFELDRGVPDWREFATSPALGLHVAGDWPQLKLELGCVKRTNR